MLKKRNIGFISTRLAGTDGVSLETEKWAQVLERMGYSCFYFAGELDRHEEKSFLCPQAHFTHSVIDAINSYVYKNSSRPEEITKQIEKLKRDLKGEIKEFIPLYEIDL